MKKNDRIYVAGHKGLVGSAVLRKLKLLNYSNIITAEKKNLDISHSVTTVIFERSTLQTLWEKCYVVA